MVFSRKKFGKSTEAASVADNEQQKKTITALISYYTTGNIKTFDEYNILWLKDTASAVDFTNAFIETYSDPLGLHATWESVVNFKDVAATRRNEIVTANAQWFEDNSPVNLRFKKKEVKGVRGKSLQSRSLAVIVIRTRPSASISRMLIGSGKCMARKYHVCRTQSGTGKRFPGGILQLTERCGLAEEVFLCFRQF
jgi:hypothetical protein